MSKHEITKYFYYYYFINGRSGMEKMDCNNSTSVQNSNEPIVSMQSIERNEIYVI